MIGRRYDDVAAEQTLEIFVPLQEAEMDNSVAERLTNGVQAFGSLFELFANNWRFEWNISIAQLRQCIGE